MEIFQYDFIIRGIIAGVIIAIVAPIIGIFLVLKRYSLIADTLAHVSLAGISLGLLLGLNPIITALGSSVISSIAIEKLRTSKKVYGESALALFLSGSLALAIVLLSFARGFNTNLFSYLFGSIATVGLIDVYLILFLAIVVGVTVFIFYKELLYATFDEDSARVSGISVNKVNIILIVLASLVVSLAIPIVGVLLISSLIVVPVITALQLKKNFSRTILWAEFFSLLSVISGIFVSFYLNISTGGTIVLIMLAIFALVFICSHKK